MLLLHNRFTYFLCLLVLTSRVSSGQDIKLLRYHIATLSSTQMAGRGYVNGGRDKAARLIQKTFREAGLRTFSGDSSDYFQTYRFSVNTFPGEVYLKMGRRRLEPGQDFLVDAASTGRNTDKLKIKKINLDKVKSREDWEQLKTRMDLRHAYLLLNTDSLCKRLDFRKHRLAANLPQGCFIVPQNNKLIWTVATDTARNTTFYVADTSMPRWKRKVSIRVDNKFEKNAISKNVLGYVPGTAMPDSFIVFTAHYDHLGKMGKSATFYGASDNASGTAAILNLARYFAAHPQRYSIAFIAFSGEEAGLLGSKFYVNNPLFPLEKIKFLVNMDMVGDAADGITVVNASEQQTAFEMLNGINAKKNYLPEIKNRENTSNSDHYPFTQKGVPAIFIYGYGGGKGHYHDIYDVARELSLKNTDNIIRLFIDFTTGMCGNN